MRSIQLMSKALADKIAAGEVVERPASIVKELVENSIDAGSTAITVEIREGGISYVRVTDNGSGIAAQDVKTAFLRHATSKMYDEEELFHIASLGFRGEALASIAAVSKIKLTTRTSDAELGTEICFAGGELEQMQETGCACGTNIVVRDLFFNTPVRRKFLKKPAQEASYIGDILSRLTLAYSSISFKFVNDGKIVLHSPGDGELLNAVQAVYGRDCAKNMIALSCEQAGLRISGCVGNSELEKNNKSYQSVYVNGRYIKDNNVAQAVLNGYVNHITIGKFPMFVLFLEMPCEAVDVNVHPNKLEVRFADEQAVYRAVAEAVAQAVNSQREIPDLMPEAPEEQRHAYEVVAQGGLAAEEEREEPTPQQAQEAVSTERVVVPAAFEKGLSAADGAVNPYIQTGDKPAAPETPAMYSKQELQAERSAQQQELAQDLYSENYRVAGQLFKTYIVVETQEAAFLIDQHAAHERLLYERLTEAMEKNSVQSQQLLAPETVHLNFTEVRALEELMPELRALGFEVEHFGGTDYIIRSVPVLLGTVAAPELLLELLEQADSARRLKAVELKRERLMQTSCKHAIKAGDSLSDAEVEALMHIISREQVPLTCPHGRPILIKLTKKELELRFKRIQQ